MTPRMSGLTMRCYSAETAHSRRCSDWARQAGVYITRPNHHTLSPAASTASKAPTAANSALTSVSLVSTTSRLDKPS